MDQIFIQHRFTIGDFTDALNILRTEYDKLTPQDIATQKQARYDKHLYDLAHPPIVVEPTKAEKLAALEVERQDLERRLSEVNGKEIVLTQADKGGSK